MSPEANPVYSIAFIIQVIGNDPYLFGGCHVSVDKDYALFIFQEMFEKKRLSNPARFGLFSLIVFAIVLVKEVPVYGEEH